MTSGTPAPIEDCDECGFRWDAYDDERAVGVFRATGALFRMTLAGVDLELANTRPAPDTWSILEYVDHVRHALWIWRFVVDVVVGDLDVDLTTAGSPPMDPEVKWFDDIEASIAIVEAESLELQATLLALTAEQWDLTSLVGLGVIDLHWIVRHALHEVLHHLHDVGRVRSRLGDGVPHQTGAVAQLNVGGGGVPKQPVDEVEITSVGVGGDHQNDRIHHGRSFQAVCLYSREVIEALVAEGHPIFAGAAGENITVAGLDWAALRPGARVTVGDEVVLELSAYAIPCAKNAAWFAAGDFRRMDQELHPGWSRLYATVLTPGRIHVGDAIVVEP